MYKNFDTTTISELSAVAGKLFQFASSRPLPAEISLVDFQLYCGAECAGHDWDTEVAAACQELVQSRVPIKVSVHFGRLHFAELSSIEGKFERGNGQASFSYRVVGIAIVSYVSLTICVGFVMLAYALFPESIVFCTILLLTAFVAGVTALDFLKIARKLNSARGKIPFSEVATCIGLGALVSTAMIEFALRFMEYLAGN